MLRVVFFISCHKTGATSLLVEQAISLAKLKDTRYLFISGEGEQFPGLFSRLRKSGIEYRQIHGLDTHTSFERLVQSFRKVINKYQPHVVNVQTNWQLAIVAACRYKCKIKFRVVYTIHGYRHNHPLMAYVARLIIGCALTWLTDLVIATSSDVKGRFSFLRKKVDLLFLGVDDAFYSRPEFPSFNGTKRMIFAGQFRNGKNQDVLIQAMRRYIEATDDEGVALYLPGTGQSLEKCKRLSKELGLGEKVFFPGHLSRADVLHYYRKCQFALVPSNNETFGHCIAEPYAMGKVIISRRVGVAEDIIRHGQTGFLFDTEDDLVEQLRLVLPDRQKCEYVVKNVIASRSVFQWDSISRDYECLIRRVASQ